MNGSHTLSGFRNAGKLFLAALLSVMVVMAGAITPAHAAGGSIVVYPPDVAEYDGKPVYESGVEYPFVVGYGSMNSGQVSTVTLPEGLSLPDSALVVPAGNTAVKQLVRGDNGELLITFADPFPADVEQGQLDLRFTVDTTETATTQEHVWRYDDESTGPVTVIVTPPGSSPTTVKSSFNKAGSSAKWPTITVDDSGKVVLGPEFLAHEITYTVTVNSADARRVNLTDVLGSNLTYVAGSLTGTKVVYDANGFNPVTAELTDLPKISGPNFAHDFDAEPKSQYTFTYTAKIADAAALEAIRVELQTKYDAVKDDDNGGNYRYALTNEATLFDTTNDTTTKKATSQTIGGTVPGVSKPNTSQAFSKGTNLKSFTAISLADDGETLSPALPLTYTLRADLRAFDGFADTKFALNTNVVISDVLPDHTEWVLGDGFITAEGIELAKVTGKTGLTAAEFNGDEYVGKYWVEGKKLLINVGKNTATNATITAQAQIVNVAGVKKNDASVKNVPAIAETWFSGPDNSAKFLVGDKSYTRTVKHSLIVEKDTTNGIVDNTKFTKTGPTHEVSAAPGSSIDVAFDFVVPKGVGDVTKSKITDYVDHEVFDVTKANISVISDALVVKYGNNEPNKLGEIQLDSTFWHLTLNSEGNLELVFSDTFAEALSDSGIGVTEKLSLTITLPTRVVTGKETLEIVNDASFEGADTEIIYNSTTSVSATTYGNEMEVRKRVYDAIRDSYTEELRVKLDEQDNFANNEFIYRIELIPHGSFQNMVADVVDALPADVTFLGFVDAEDVQSGTVSSTEPYVISGTNIEATYSDELRQVRVQQGKLNRGETAALYFKVSIDDYESEVGITNVIGGTHATIVPFTPTYAIGDVVWIDTHKDVDPAAHGDQGEQEFLDGVTVKLFEKNLDGQWQERGETVTKDGGRYLFDELPAGTYRVQFILTDEQAKLYDFTTALAEGVAAAANSDAGENGFSGEIVLNDGNAALDREYEDQEFTATEGVDPTWDAGVVLKPAQDTPGEQTPGEPTPGDPTPGEPTPGDPASGLPATGGVAPTLLLVAAALALALGSGFMLWSRRRTTEM